MLVPLLLLALGAHGARASCLRAEELLAALPETADLLGAAFSTFTSEHTCTGSDRGALCARDFLMDVRMGRKTL